MDSKEGKRGKQIERRKKGVIRAKSDFFRTARYGLKILEHRIIYYAILRGQQEGKPFEPVTLTIKELEEICEFKGSSSYSRVRKLTNEIVGKSLEIVYKDKEGTHIKQATWLSSITYHAREGQVTIVPNKEIAPFFEGKPYTDTEYYFLIKFTSQYAERLYEIVKTLAFKKIIDFDVADIRQRLAVPPDMYPNFKDFRIRVLERAIQDINTYTDLSISMKEKRGYRNKVEKIFFAVSEKDVPKLYERVSKGEFSPPLTESQQEDLIRQLLEDEEEYEGQLLLDGVNSY